MDVEPVPRKTAQPGSPRVEVQKAGPVGEEVGPVAQVLRDDGILYVNANGLGWYKHLWNTRHNGSPDYDPRLVAAQTLLNTCRYDAGEPPQPGMDVIIEPDDLRARLTDLGLEAITWVPDTFLLAHSFVDESTGSPYAPASYPNHGGGLFFVGLELNGTIYAYALDHTAVTFHRVATITSGPEPSPDCAERIVASTTAVSGRRSAAAAAAPRPTAIAGVRSKPGS